MSFTTRKNFRVNWDNFPSVILPTINLLAKLYFASKKMNITLFITENCSSCLRVESQLKKILKNKNDINLLVENIKMVRSRGIVIAPALFIDDELHSYGDLDEDKFLEQISPVRAKQ